MTTTPTPPKYQVAYEGQIITNPLDFDTAHYIAAAENLDSFALGYVSACEVVIAQSPSHPMTTIPPTEPQLAPAAWSARCARTASDLLQRIVAESKLRLLTTFDPERGGELLYLVEVVGTPGNVYAQGFGGSLESAEVECLADLNQQRLNARTDTQGRDVTDTPGLWDESDITDTEATP
jgi:hypothetical protein